MGIGTSAGAFYDDAFHEAAARWDPKYDENNTPDNNVQSDLWTQQQRTYPSTTPTEVGKKSDMPFPDNNNPDSDFNNRFGNLPPSGILNDLKKPQDQPLIRKISDVQSPDYDMDAWQKATGLTSLPEGEHYPDTYKLPNHMTFSDESVYHGVNGNEGGHWDKIEGDSNYDWKFTPGKTNLDNHTPEELKDYFNKVEPRSKLILPDKR